MIFKKKNLKVAIIGLGYVGLPLALALKKKKSIIGFDLDKKRIKQLNLGIDKNLEFGKDELLSSKKLKFTNNIKDINNSKLFYHNCSNSSR